jgi:hypothetical protein
MTNLLLKYKEQEVSYDQEQVKLASDLQDIAEIQTHLLDYVRQQNHPLLRIEENIAKAKINIEEGHKDLEIANSYYVSYKPILIGSIVGGLTMSPIGIIIGTKLVALGGVLVGACTGYHIQKV